MCVLLFIQFFIRIESEIEVKNKWKNHSFFMTTMGFKPTTPRHWHDVGKLTMLNLPATANCMHSSCNARYCETFDIAVITNHLSYKIVFPRTINHHYESTLTSPVCYTETLNGGTTGWYYTTSCTAQIYSVSTLHSWI